MKRTKATNGINFDTFNESGFYGVPQQITDKIKEHEVSTKQAIDENTEMLEEFKETMHEDVTAQTEQQKEDANENRKTFTNVFGAFTKIFKGIFTKDKGDISGETFYEMVQRENDETQAYMSAHTAMIQSESNETQAIMTAHTEAMNLDLNDVVEAIRQCTSGNTVNISKLIETLSANTQTINSAISNNTNKIGELKSANETGFGNVVNAIDRIDRI